MLNDAAMNNDSSENPDDQRQQRSSKSTTVKKQQINCQLPFINLSAEPAVAAAGSVSQRTRRASNDVGLATTGAGVSGRDTSAADSEMQI